MRILIGACQWPKDVEIDLVENSASGRKNM